MHTKQAFTTVLAAVTVSNALQLQLWDNDDCSGLPKFDFQDSNSGNGCYSLPAGLKSVKTSGNPTQGCNAIGQHEYTAWVVADESGCTGHNNEWFFDCQASTCKPCNGRCNYRQLQLASTSLTNDPTAGPGNNTLSTVASTTAA